ncbi:hypothetical protein DFQ26_002832 [Actinomortierella ambigua]|nr:hypothetical protein DFQ26_002832 [Actinomortierella ambigua]
MDSPILGTDHRWVVKVAASTIATPPEKTWTDGGIDIREEEEEEEDYDGDDEKEHIEACFSVPFATNLDSDDM